MATEMDINNLTIYHFRRPDVRNWGEGVLDVAPHIKAPPETEVIESLERAIANPTSVDPADEEAFKNVFTDLYRQVIKTKGTDHLRLESQGFEASLSIFREADELLDHPYGTFGESSATPPKAAADRLFSDYPDIENTAQKEMARLQRLLEQASNKLIRNHLRKLTDSLKIILEMGLHDPTRARRELLQIQLQLDEIDRYHTKDLREGAHQIKETLDRTIDEDWFQGNSTMLGKLSDYIGKKLAANELDDELEWYTLVANILFTEGIPGPVRDSQEPAHLQRDEPTASGALAERHEFSPRYERYLQELRAALSPNDASLWDHANTIWRIREHIATTNNPDIPIDKHKGVLAKREKDFESLFDTATTLSWMLITTGNEPLAQSAIYEFERNPFYASAIHLAAAYRSVLGTLNSRYRKVVRPTIVNTITNKDFVNESKESKLDEAQPFAAVLPAIIRLGATIMHLELAGDAIAYLLKLGERMNSALTMSIDNANALLKELRRNIQNQTPISGKLFFPLTGHPAELALFADEPFAENAEILSPLPHTLPLTLLSAILAVRPGGLIKIFYKSDDDPSTAAKLAQAMGFSSKMVRGGQQLIRVSDIRGGGDDRPKGKGPGPKPPSPKGKGRKRAMSSIHVGGLAKQRDLFPRSKAKFQSPVRSNLRWRRRRALNNASPWMGTNTLHAVGTTAMTGVGVPNLITIMRAPVLR